MIGANLVMAIFIGGNMKAILATELEELPDEIREEFDEQYFQEGRSVVYLQHSDGAIINWYTDKGEPEDNSFYRNYAWVVNAINDAYTSGFNRGCQVPKNA